MPMTFSSSQNDPSANPLSLITALDLAFTESKLDAAIQSMAPMLGRFLPVPFWFPARATARIVVARVQFYPTAMMRPPRAGAFDNLAIPLFVASTDRGWDPFDEDGRRIDNVFDRAAGVKLPPVEARSIEERQVLQMAKIGFNTLATDGTILPPCHVPRSIAGRDDVFLIGAGANWFSLPQRRIIETARYPLLVFRGRAQWAACLVPAWFWNPIAYAQRRHFTASNVRWPLSPAVGFSYRLPRNLLWPPYELPM
jgi:hypothetical protein